MRGYTINRFPKSRIATIDVCETGKKRHHVVACLELDVTAAREKIKLHRKDKEKVSFMAWLIKVFAATLENHKTIAAYRRGKRSVVMFDEISVSLLVEKESDGSKVPLPLLIRQANHLSLSELTQKIGESRAATTTGKDVVLHRRPTVAEQMYYYLPGFVRLAFWRILIKRPAWAMETMGNVAVTSLASAGKINGWFFPITLHPVCFGVGSVVRKPLVVGDKIEIREVLNLTVMMDHDVADGAPMARFIKELSSNTEKGAFL